MRDKGLVSPSVNWQTDAMELTGFLSPDEFWAMHDRLEHQVLARASELPLYQIEDWNGPLMLGMWQMDASEGSVQHGNRPPLSLDEPRYSVEVITTVGSTTELALHKWREVSGPLTAPMEGGRPGFNFPEPKQYIWTLDGTPTTFDIRNGPAFWVAVSNATEPGVVVVTRTGRPVPDTLNITRVPDVAPLLQTRRAALRGIRGEA